MPIKAILPSNLPDEITDLGADDYLVAQKSGTSKLYKLKPAAIAPADIGAAAAAHVANHKTNGSDALAPADIGAMATSHAANSITGFGTSAAALGTSAAGTATTVSRSDHVHALPSLATLGAAAVTGNVAQDFFCKTLIMPNGSSNTPATMRGPWDDAINNWSWTFTIYNYVAYIMCESLQVRNRNHTAYARLDAADIYANNGDVYARGVKLTSDPRLKRNLSAPTSSFPSAKTLEKAVIEFNFKSDASDKPRRLGFNAQTIAELARAASISKEPDQQIIDERGLDRVLGIDLTALVAILVSQVARLEERLERMEQRLAGQDKKPLSTQPGKQH